MNEVNQGTAVFPVSLRELTAKAAKWMGFAGYVWIISGGITCLSIVGVIFGIPYILIGLNIKKAADLLQEYINNGEQESLEAFVSKLGKHFFIYSMLVIAGLVLFALYMVLVFYLIATKGTVTELPAK